MFAMLATTLFVMLIGLFALLLVSVGLRERATMSANATVTGADGETAVMSVMFSGGTACAAGDVGDAGGD